MSWFEERAACPACTLTARQELFSASLVKPPLSTYLHYFYSPQGGIEPAYLEDAQFILDECKTCGLIYQRFVPNDFLMTKLYEQWINPQLALDAHVRSTSLIQSRVLSRQIEALLHHFNSPPHQLTFLDFGMGWGDWCSLAQAYGCKVFGVELSDTRIEYAQRKGVRVLQWSEISQQQFDFINTEQVFEHIAKPLETLEYLVAALKPNALIRISVPDGRGIKSNLAVGNWMAPKGSRRSLNPVAPLEHLNCYSPDALMRMAQLAGLSGPVNVRPHDGQFVDQILDVSVRDILRPLHFAHRWLTTGHTTGALSMTFHRSPRPVS